MRKYWPWILMAASALVLLVSLGVLLGADTFGNVASWVEAIGTTAAFVAALLLLRHEVETRRRDVDERVRRQASLVSCWLERVPGPMIAGGGDIVAGPPSWRVVVRNASDEPVYRVCVTQPPHAPGSMPLTGWALVKPGHEASEVVDAEIDAPPETTAGVTFIDAAGLGWERGHDGILRRYPGLDGLAVVDADTQGC